MEESNEKARDKKRNAGSGISVRVIGGIAIIAAIALAFFAFALAGRVADVEEAAASDERHYIECGNAISDLQEASDYLTSQARMYVVTGNRKFLDGYLNESTVENRRGMAVEVLRSSFSASQEAADELEQALASSNELAKTELAAMRLAAEHYGLRDVPEMIKNANVSSHEKEIGENGKLGVAMNLLLDERYDKAKNEIQAEVDASSSALLEVLNEGVEQNKALMQNLLFQLRISVALLLCVVMVLVLALFMYVLKPLSRYVKRIEKNEPLEADGAYELHYLANAYNAMYEDNAQRIEQLREFAERDPLTGISNRIGYDSFLATHTRNIALILIDIDHFKEYNEVYGHDTGDAALVKLAAALSTAFRSTDFPCRIESDKFAVVMTNMSDGLRSAISSKVDLVNSILADDSDDLPVITMSVGAAFSAEGMGDKDIYRAANAALQQAKQADSSEIVFYGEHNAS